MIYLHIDIAGQLGKVFSFSKAQLSVSYENKPLCIVDFTPDKSFKNLALIFAKVCCP